MGGSSPGIGCAAKAWLKRRVRPGKAAPCWSVVLTCRGSPLPVTGATLEHTGLPVSLCPGELWWWEAYRVSSLLNVRATPWILLLPFPHALATIQILHTSFNTRFPPRGPGPALAELRSGALYTNPPGMSTAQQLVKTSSEPS